MDPAAPFLEVTGPDGQRMVAQLTQARTTIGRYPPPFNDIALQPDPQRYVTREVHCYVEHRGANWYVVSNGKNATLLSQGRGFRPVQGQALLADGDKIYIQGGLSETSEREPLFWELLFRDPEGTQPTYAVAHSAYLEYEESSCRLFKVGEGARDRILLRPLEDKLIRYMLARNQQNQKTPVLIPVSELMRAVWDEEGEGHSPQELHKLIASLRRKLEPDIKAPQFLVNERGLGYLLDTHPQIYLPPSSI